MGSKRRASRYQVAAPAWSRKIQGTWVSPRLISSLLLVVAGWLLYWFATGELFYIRSVRSEGNWRLPETELLTITGLEGVNVFWVDARVVEQALELLPDVESAHVRCSLPADCVVELVERPVTLVWQQGDARVWIGSDGVAVPARGELPNAIVLEAVGSTALRPGDRLPLTLVAAVKELEERQPEVRVYQFSDRYGLSFEGDYGWQVRLGQGEGIAARLDLSNALADHLLGQGVVPTYVDVRYPQAPYYGE